MKLLIVEDEPKTAAYLKKGLEENGFVADVAADGETGAYMARQGGYELVILDVMLPARTAGRCCANCASTATWSRCCS